MNLEARIARLQIWWTEYHFNQSKKARDMITLDAWDLMDDKETYQHALVVLLARWLDSIELEAQALTALRISAPDLYKTITTKELDTEYTITSMLKIDSEQNLEQLQMEWVDKQNQPLQTF